jgi:hypothetical protein
MTIRPKPREKRLRIITSGQYSFCGISKTAAAAVCLSKRRESWLIFAGIASFAAANAKQGELRLLSTLNRATLAAFVGGPIVD